MSFGFGFGFPKADTVAAGGVPGGGASLRLNFLDSTTLDPRVTFSRTSNATVFDNTGKLIYAPHNLMPNSESFDNAAWTKSNAVVTANAAVAPDGTTTADLLISTGADGYVGRSLAGISGGLTYVGSMYLRSDTPVSVRLYLVETAGGSNVQLATCNVTTSWQRFSVSITTGTAVTSLALQVGGAFSFSANETVYAWGAQLNVANAPGDNLLTFSEEFDNAAWTKTNSSIQSNLLTFSEQFDNAVWTKSNSFIQTNQVRNNTMQGAVAGSPGTTPTNWIGVGAGLGTLTQTIVGTGTVNGINYIDYRINGTTSTTSYGLGFDGFTQIVASVGQIWTSSVYVARVGGSTANFAQIFQRLINRDATGVNLGSDSIDLIPTLSTTLTRVPLTRTLAGVGTAYVSNDILFAFTSGVAIDITLRIGWPQLVLGAVAGDPVPTYGIARAVQYTAPDGSITADKLSEDISAATTHRVGPAASIAMAAGSMFFSVYLKAGERTTAAVNIFNATDGERGVNVDLVAGTITSVSGTVPTRTITAVGDGWYRVAIGVTATVAANTTPLVYINLYGNYTGDGTSGIYVWGAQLVQGSEPYDYVRTDATPVAIGYSAPDATMTADKLVEDTATSEHRIGQLSITWSGGITYSTSFYVKAAGRSRFDILFGTAGNWVNGDPARIASFNLQTGTVSLVPASPGTASIVAVGGDWYRCIVTATAVAAPAPSGVFLRMADSTGSATYTGDGVSGVLLWGAQLNVGATALPYVETTNSIYPVPSYNDTTVQNLLGFTQEFDNATWTKAASYIQTNLLTFSEQLDNATWAKVNSVIQTNQIRNNTMQGAVAGTPGTTPTNWAATAATELTRQVVGVGVEDGVTYIDLRYTGTVTATRLQYVFLEPSNAIPAVNGQQWCGSAWLKLVAGSLNNITALNIQADTRDAALVYVNTPYISAVPLDSTFTRYSATGLATGATVAWIQPFIYFSTAASGVIDITLRIGWPQLVLGNAAGDPVATAGTALPVQYTAPDASVTAELMIGNPGITTKYVFNQFSTTTTGPYTASVYAKAGTDNFVIVRVTDNTGGNAARQRFNLATGAKDGAVGIEGTVTNGLSEITPVGNGWYRCSVTGTFNSALTLIQANFWLNTYGTVGLTTSILLWGAQLVQGAVPGDYQETVATARAVMYPAPDGSVTADKLVENTANAQHVVFRSTTIVANTPHAASGYFKAGERTRINFRLLNGSFNSGATITFDLSNGTAPFSGVVGTGSNLSFSITPVGNGWYRCFASCVVDATSTSAVWAAYTVISGNNDSYTGDGTSGIYIWGAQLSDSASLDPYVYNPVAAPTAAAYYGPRFDYDPSTLAARGLLIEEQRTNSIRNNSMVGAVAGTPGTLPTNWFTFTALTGLTQQIVGVGTENGIQYVDFRLFGTPGGAPGSLTLFLETLSNIVAAPTQVWSNSAFVKLAGGSLANLSVSIGAQARTAAAGFIAQYTGSATPTGTLSRVTFTTPALPALTERIEPVIVFNFTAGVATDITLRIGLPQLELGAFATSVIPTTTAAATRTADVATMVGANFSNWYRQDEGTAFTEQTRPTAAIPDGNVLQIDDGSNNNRHSIGTGASGLVLNPFAVAGGLVQATLTQALNTGIGTQKLAYAYKLNDYAASTGGAASIVDTSALVPVANTMRIGYAFGGGSSWNGYIRQVTYFPRRLANSELQTVTL